MKNFIWRGKKLEFLVSLNAELKFRVCIFRVGVWIAKLNLPFEIQFGVYVENQFRRGEELRRGALQFDSRTFTNSKCEVHIVNLAEVSYQQVDVAECCTMQTLRTENQ